MIWYTICIDMYIYAHTHIIYDKQYQREKGCRSSWYQWPSVLDFSHYSRLYVISWSNTLAAYSIIHDTSIGHFDCGIDSANLFVDRFPNDVTANDRDSYSWERGFPRNNHNTSTWQQWRRFLCNILIIWFAPRWHEPRFSHHGDCWSAYKGPPWRIKSFHDSIAEFASVSESS